jgi:MYXO-CTERM domain-containing protein
MSGRIDALEARRQALLNKCEEQRLELAYRVAQLRPAARLTAWTRRSGAGAGKSPLTWIAGLAGLLLLLRRRRVVSGVGWIAGLVALASRATTILRLLAQLRAIYLSYSRSARRP